MFDKWNMGSWYQPLSLPLQMLVAKHFAPSKCCLDTLAYLTPEEFAIKDTASPFITGSEITTADGALFPTIVFMQFILPRFFGSLTMSCQHKNVHALPRTPPHLFARLAIEDQQLIPAFPHLWKCMDGMLIQTFR
eukprot:1146395-Pelagomonas_calceolata.AAC.2